MYVHEVVMGSWPPSYKGVPVIATNEGDQELTRLGLTLWDVVEILKDGYDCGTGSRAQDVFEKCLRIDGKEIKLVGAYTEWEPYTQGPAWRFWHIKETGRSP